MLKTFSSFIFAALLSQGFFLGANGEATKKFAPGMYKIVNPESLTWVRGLPGPGQHGPWMSPITMAWDMSSIYQTWEVSAFEEGYKIQNYGSKMFAFSRSHEVDNLVLGFSDGFTKWYIEPTGGSEYRIHYPNRDLVWTVNYDDNFPDTVSLKPFEGGEDQIFRFDKL
ncbi:hypothetical protein Agabi119p4_9953 [Agaricus bisporus var. burnettii]|uniref:Ricin B lectin domain-containing protein n=1 Tax=Agaricus bisporus var. burnettii TaxID=192524 RepID=A0A8H7C4S4_AGABI|nr:hypothetical protein Agabi119p4_9953 [Agaricus bisporus var. burnettii]